MWSVATPLQAAIGRYSLCCFVEIEPADQPANIDQGNRSAGISHTSGNTVDG